MSDRLNEHVAAYRAVTGRSRGESGVTRARLLRSHARRLERRRWQVAAAAAAALVLTNTTTWAWSTGHLSTESLMSWWSGAVQRDASERIAARRATSVPPQTSNAVRAAPSAPRRGTPSKAASAEPGSTVASESTSRRRDDRADRPRERSGARRLETLPPASEASSEHAVEPAVFGPERPEPENELEDDREHPAIAELALSGPERSDPQNDRGSTAFDLQSMRIELDGLEARVATSADRRAYQRAHQTHFADERFALALRQWDRYLASFPEGRFRPEASFNRAICLIRLDRLEEARAALVPLTRQAASLRREEAALLIRAIDDDRVATAPSAAR